MKNTNSVFVFDVKETGYTDGDIALTHWLILRPILVFFKLKLRAVKLNVNPVIKMIKNLLCPRGFLKWNRQEVLW